MLDVGTSVGVWGLTEGYSLMIGGDEDAYNRLEPITQTLAPDADNGYGYAGPAGRDTLSRWSTTALNTA